MARTATCACGRLQVVVEREPASVVTCHCEYCQRRTGSVFQVSAVFPNLDGVTVTGDTSVYNGRERNGVASANGDEVSYHFCPTCGSTVYWTFGDRPTLAVAVGAFADRTLPAPVAELHAPQRHGWVSPVDGAAQFEAFRPR